jgi:hypothetical protein
VSERETANKQLAILSGAAAALAKCRTLPEIINIRNAALAAESYAKAAKLGGDSLAYATEIKILAERKAGGKLAELEKEPGKRRDLTSAQGGAEVSPYRQAIRQAQIGDGQAKRWQQLARLSVEETRAAIEAAKQRVQRASERGEVGDSRIKVRKSFNAASVKIDSRIIAKDFRQGGSEIADDSISLVFTDAPYDRKAAADLFPALAEFGARVLKPGGSLFCYVGHIQLPLVFSAFGDKLRYWWTCACLHTDSAGTPMRELGIHVFWKPIVWYVKGTRGDATQIIRDADQKRSQKEKSHHDWQQSVTEASYYISLLCPKTGVVCDPFLGSGTTALAAMQLGRQWIGFESDKATAKAATERINAGTIQHPR